MSQGRTHTRRLPAAWAGLLALSACLAGVLGTDRPAAGRGARVDAPRQDLLPVEAFLDLGYNPAPDASPRQRLDIYLPAGRGSAPILVFAPAGAWSAGDRRAYRVAAEHLAELGLAVALVDHRLSDGTADAVRHPEHVRDLAMATGFIRSWLLIRGREADAIFLGGHEAGAHLAALLAADGRYLAEQGLTASNIKGVVGLSGIYEIDPGARTWPEVFGLDPLARAAAAPASHIDADTPPMLLLSAEADRPGRAEQAGELASDLLRAGSLGDARVIEGRDADSLIFYLGWAADEATDLILLFVQQRLSAKPRATGLPTLPPPPTATPTPVDAAPPGLPERGPGSARRAMYERVAGEERQIGALRWWRFSPAGAVAEDPLLSARLPVVVFLPDPAAAPEPIRAYWRWMEHVAIGGAMVLSPALSDAPPDGRFARLLETLPVALAEAYADPELGPRLDRDAVYWAGHGEGATLAARAAADWYDRALPLPRALLLAQPRDARAELRGPELRRLPKDLLVLVIAAEDDEAPDVALEERLWDRLAHIPPLWRERLVLRSDAHGRPALDATFAAAYSDAPGGLDGLDGFGYWKWLDALLDCGRFGTHCAFAFGGGPDQLGMGEWSDGVPARPAVRSPGPPRRRPWRVLMPWAGRKASR